MARKAAASDPVDKTYIVYSAGMSLDGFIADDGGGVDWLNKAIVKGEGYGLSEFFASVDAVLMGSGTYEAAAALGGSTFKSTMPCWVFSKRPLKGKGVTITTADPAEVVSALPAQGIRRAWLMGGGKLASSFLAAGLLDEISIGLMPVILGSGIPLFAGGIAATHLELIRKVEYKGGSFGLTYRPRRPSRGTRGVSRR